MPDSEESIVANMAVQAAALSALTALPDAISGPYAVTVRRGNVNVRVLAWPDGAEPDGKPTRPDALDTQCKRDILAVLLSLGASPDRRFVGDAIHGELDRRNALHGARTVRGALAELTVAGLLLNDRDSRGYGLSVLGASAARLCSPV